MINTKSQWSIQRSSSWATNCRLCQCVTMKTTFIMSNKARKRKVNVLESRNPNPNQLLCWFFLLFEQLWSQFEQDFFQQKARTNFAKLGYDFFNHISIIFQVLIFWPGPNHADRDVAYMLLLIVLYLSLSTLSDLVLLLWLDFKGFQSKVDSVLTKHKEYIKGDMFKLSK